jgi:hypothetical protein
MTDRYTQLYRITPSILHSIEQIGEALGNLRVGSDSSVVPALRRGNRIKTVQATLAIEGNTLSLEQVTAVLSGKLVLAQPREIQEVRNAFAAYEKLPEWNAHSRTDLLAAHGLLMAGLASDQENDHQSDQVMRLLRTLWKSQRSASDLMAELELSHRPTFRKNYLHPALEAGLIEMTQPGTPRARNQKYRLTPLGMQRLSTDKEANGI